MQVQPENGVLAIQGIRELDATSLRAFRQAVATAVRLRLPAIDMDLSQVSSMDASAVGILTSCYRLASRRPPTGRASVRLLNPQPGVLQMLELARMDLLYEIVMTPTGLIPLERAPATLLQAA